jgi:hypothetical protein
MHLTPVKSDAVTHVGHDGKDLTVLYRGGRRYVHRNVPEQRYKQLLASDSIGRFLNDHIRKQYPGVAQ